jgi:hypothetical protein
LPPASSQPTTAVPPAAPALAPGPNAGAVASVTPVAFGPADPEAAAVLQKKRQACRQDAVGRGLRGPEVGDAVTLCVAEARLACLRQAVAQHVRTPERRDFLIRCLGGS